MIDRTVPTLNNQGAPAMKYYMRGEKARSQSLKKLNCKCQQKSGEDETCTQPFFLYHVMSSVLQVHPDSASSATSGIPKHVSPPEVNERDFKVE